MEQAQPQSLDELFSRGADWTDQELDVIIAELRRQRATWAQAEAQGKRSAPKSGPKTQADPGLSIEDLGL